MKNITLKRLELTNYRNIEYAVYDFNGSSTIVGDNRIGKTNTLESIYWLLTDKLLDGSSEVSAIKPLRDTKLEVRVKATFDIDGKVVTLEKRYKENWVKTRGTTDLEMKGHVITWIHNDVKQSTLKAYNQLVCEDFGFTQDATTKIDFMQMLINPFYLANIGEGKDWTELRAFIIKLIGDVSDADIVAARPELSIIKKDLDSVGGRIDQLKKKYSLDIDALKNQIISDEGQIKLLEETPNPTDCEVTIAVKAIQEHQDNIISYKAINGVDVASIDIEKKINEKLIEVARLEKEDLLRAKENSKTKEVEEKISILRKKQFGLIESKVDTQTKKNKFERELSTCDSEFENLNSHRSLLLLKLKELDSTISNPNIEIECPHCHRPYEKDEIGSRRRSIIDAALKEKAELIKDGKNTKQKMNELNEKIDALKKEIEIQENELADIENELVEVGNEITQLSADLERQELPLASENPQIEIIKKEIEKLRLDLRESRDAYSKGIQDNQQRIYDEEQAMIPFKKVVSDREYYHRQMDQLAFVKSNHIFHSKELADMEQKKELLNNFIYTKLKMLDDNVSKVFGKIKFQLIKENINGGFDTVCKAYIYDTVAKDSTSTLWKSGSKSERVVTGIAIVEVIKEKLGLPNLPFLFDEGGEISSDTFRNRIVTNSQLICVKIADNIMSPLVQNL